MSKNLVVLSAFLTPFRSGAEAMVEEVMPKLSSDFQITIVTGRYKSSLKKHDVLANSSVQIVRVGFGLSIDKYLYPFLAPLAARKLKPDIIHAVLESYAGLALVFCKYVSSAKRMLTLQSTNTSFMLRSMHKSAHVITAISDVLAERAKKFGRNDVVVIANGMDLDAIKEAGSFHARDSGRILFVGRLEPMKGVDTLLKAFAEAIPRVPPHVHLRIVGDGSERAKLEALSKELDIEPRVEFAGSVTPRQAYDEYAQAEIFCGLSRSEALGNVFIEAMASGCAVIATNVGGIPDVVKNEETGLLVPVDDSAAAAQAIKRLITDMPLRAKLSTAAKRGMEKYGWSGIAKQYANVLRQVA